jgi:Rrf2 family protein
MRLSSLADHAVVMMSAAARHRAGGRLSATTLSGQTGVPLPTAQKLMGRLAASGLLTSARGAGGGFALARDARDITVADIVEAVDGPIAPAKPVPAAPSGIVHAAIRGALAGVTLAVLIGEVMS